MLAPFVQSGRAAMRRPGSSCAAVLTLALGISASTAVFTLADVVLFKKLPYPNAGRIVALDSVRSGGSGSGFSWQDMNDLQAGTRSFEAISVFRKRTFELSDSTAEPKTVVLAGTVTHGFFRVLGVTPKLGRTFTAEDEYPGSNHIVWLSNSLWRRRYKGSPKVVGQSISLNEVQYRVAGVLPAWFHFLIQGETPDLYFPLDRQVYCCGRDVRTLGAIALLAPGVSVANAEAELPVVSKRLGTAHPETNRRVQFRLTSLRDSLSRSHRTPLLLLLAAVGLLMLVTTANAGGILLARAAVDVRQIAIRVSLGARWRDLLLDRIAVAFWLSIAAGISGSLGAWVLLRIAAVLPYLRDTMSAYSRFGTLRPNEAVLAFSFLSSIAAATVAALIPLLALKRTTLEHLLRAGYGASFSSRTVWTGKAMAAVQIALSASLLITGSLVLQSLYQTLKSNRGYNTAHILTAGIGIPESRYDTDAKIIDFHARVIERLRHIPGVFGAAGGVGIPITTLHTSFLREGEHLPLSQRPRARVAIASPGLFKLLRISLLMGRGFRANDRIGEPYVALVNQAFARRFLAGRRAVGAHLRIGFWDGHMKPWSDFQIVGVFADTHNVALDQPAAPEIVLSSLQVPLEGFHYMIRAARNTAGLQREIRQTVWSVDPNLEAVSAVPLEDRIEGALAGRRFVLWLLGSFAVLALLVAVTGLSGSLAAAVAQERRTIGIRMALGELPAQVVGRILRSAIKIVVLGAICGALGAAAIGQLLTKQIAHFSGIDPASIAAVLAILVSAALISALVPAWRAAHIDPVESLREP